MASASACGSGTKCEQLAEYLLDRHREPLQRVLHARDPSLAYRIPVTFLDLHNYSPQLAGLLLAAPKRFLGTIERAAIQAQERLLQEEEMPNEHKPAQRRRCAMPKENTRVGVDLSACPAVCPLVRDISSEDVGRLVKLRGTIVRTSPVKMLEAAKLLECSRCKFRFAVPTDLEQGGTFDTPSTCPAPASSSRGCHGESAKERATGLLQSQGESFNTLTL
eukprot:scaffold1762_cov383-Prasinococcus_capsulatus_cf.AAC.5